MTSTRTTPTRILVLSDTHSALPGLTNKPELKFCQPFPEADVAIHCGDLTSCGRIEEHRRAFSLLRSLPAPIKIVIPGNHDMTLDKQYMENNKRLHGWQVNSHSMNDYNDALQIYTSQEAKDAGIRYLVEGVQSFVLPNGAKLTVYASAYTPEFWNWAFPYPRSEDRYNVREENAPANPIPSFTPQSTENSSVDEQVAVMVTHGPPYGKLDETIRGDKVGCEHLLSAVSRCRPLLHCFGHIHEGWGAELCSWSKDVDGRGSIDSPTVTLRTPDEPVSRADEKSRRGAEDLLNSEQMLPVYHPTDPTNNSRDKHGQDLGAASFIDATTLEHGKQTLFVNASIMTVRYVPAQWPWLVRLQLPTASTEEMNVS